ncbi:type VII secretion-associated serine protease mycosin [Rhodococcus sp. BUPNP1]|uniref:type VII secretion-associated serine protease mycosin n=1 Tax=Rhodococcus sp. BUPNP1 TaxID=1432786 RepID=UPI000B5A7407|nr:type VII secretion-associated serine protease mycosin [Rhodococcus sp. BUPNP1]OWY81984.1 type VII secretion-associated serine protease mycosin [Rhodococcus sp. BUPNP1]
MTVRLSHRFAVLALAALVATTTPGLATAAPPVPDPAQLPAGATPAPPEATEMRVLCAELPDAPDGPQIPRAQRILDFASVWPITRGSGQVVAVIDTGVHPHPRLPAPRPGGDYVSTGDGTEDCDAHGTLVAGLIAARPTPGSGFAGGAPDVGIIAIRQSSGHFSDRSRSDDDAARNASGYGDVRTLAAAVRQAVDLGATVVNISEVACRTVAEGLVDGPLGAAVQYATDVHDAVVVAAAGNTDTCREGNPRSVDPADPGADPWDSVVTLASPAWYDEYVLTVGAVEDDGTPAEYSLPGPWVDVAAPGSGLVSLNPGTDGLADLIPGPQGGRPVSGTSFAAPLVAATVALVRSRHPQLSAREVMARIENTAHSPAEGWNPRVGHGVVDPLAAVTAPLPAERAQPVPAVAVAEPTPPPVPDHRPRTIALISAATVIAATALVLVLTAPARRLARSRT